MTAPHRICRNCGQPVRTVPGYNDEWMHAATRDSRCYLTATRGPSAELDLFEYAITSR